MKGKHTMKSDMQALNLEGSDAMSETKAKESEKMKEETKTQPNM